MPNYYSPEGNYEVWKEKPEGYFTAEEWLKSHPPETQYPALAIQSEIAELKEQLTASDYKIIKYSEYQFSGLESPYDIAEIHAERQVIRDKINELEANLSD